MSYRDKLWIKDAMDPNRPKRVRMPKIMMNGILIYDETKKGFIYKSNRAGGSAFDDNIKNPCPLVEGSKVLDNEKRERVAPREVSVMECMSCEYNRMAQTPEKEYFVVCSSIDFHEELNKKTDENFLREQASVADQWRRNKQESQRR